MPISEDEIDYHSIGEATSTMSKAELRKELMYLEVPATSNSMKELIQERNIIRSTRRNLRKKMTTHKPIMEKRRRARINHCLNEIKGLILEAMKKDPARHSKLEKADILEMAVKHLQNVQRQQLAIAMASDSSVLRKFKTGFNDCAREITSYLSQIDNNESGLRDRISVHLSKCINSIEHIAQFNFPGLSAFPFLTNNSTPNPFAGVNKPHIDTNIEDQNNNPCLQIPQRIQLIPSRLPSGEIAFLLPNSSSMQCFSEITTNTTVNKDVDKKTQRTSAFVTVLPSTSTVDKSDGLKINLLKPLSPPHSPCATRDKDYLDASNSNLSPRGFRPVNPTLQKSYNSAFISTVNSKHKTEPDCTKPRTNTNPVEANHPNVFENTSNSELRNIQYPISKFSTCKTNEPLCVITNQAERYKQAHTIDETVTCSENFQRGTKRKHCELSENQGLLTVASNEGLYSNDVTRRTKYSMTEIKLEQGSSSSSHCDAINEGQSNSVSSSKSGRNNNDGSNDMWRPW